MIIGDFLLSLARRLPAAGALVLAACGSGPLLQSRPVEAARRQALEGDSYYLPKKILKIDVWLTTAMMTREPPPAIGGLPPPPLQPGAAAQAPPEPELQRRTLYFATFGDERVVPDLRRHFMLETVTSSASEDDIEVTKTPDGLLDMVTGTSTDKTKDIVGSLSNLASLLVSGMPNFESAATRDLTADAMLTSPPRLVASYEFDPIDPRDLARVRAELWRRRISLTVAKQSDCPVAASGAGCDVTEVDCSPGVYYRLPLPYRVTLSPSAELQYPRAALPACPSYPLCQTAPPPAGPPLPTAHVDVLDSYEKTFLLPNEALCKYVPVTRAAFVAKKTTLDFEQGMLTKVTTHKPSELLGFVTIPVDAARTIMAIPAELLKIRIERKNQENALTAGSTAQANAEAANLQAMIDLMKATQRYQSALQAPDTSTAREIAPSSRGGAIPLPPEPPVLPPLITPSDSPPR